MMPEVILQSVLTCPECGHKKTESMPTDACQWYYECEQCHTLLKPKAGDCCVYCSYGSVPCPPIQLTTESKGKGGCCGTQTLYASCQFTITILHTPSSPRYP